MMPSRALRGSRALLSVSDVGFGGAENLSVSISSVTCGLDLERSCGAQTAECVCVQKCMGWVPGDIPEGLGSQGTCTFTT